MAKILIADDDVELTDTLKDLLAPDRHSVDVAYNGQDADEFAKAYGYDLIVLDWNMPEITGLDLCVRLRERGCVTPILMLTGKSAVDDKEMGLEAGADDYLTKPFHPRELKARIKALLRRPGEWLPDRIVDGDLVLEAGKRRAIKTGIEIHLQPLEFALLEFFLRHPDKVFSLDELQRKVWDSDEAVSTNAIYAAVGRLRQKIDSPRGHRRIVNVHGYGYRYVPERKAE